MKKLLIVLPLILVLISLLTACSDKTAPLNQTPSSTTRAAQTSDDDEVDYSGLQDFVSAINDQYADAALNLFNDDAAFNEIDQVAMMSNLHQNGWNHMYAGKAEIKDWLAVEIGSNAQIVPREYKLYANYPSMSGTLYYQDQVMDLQLIEKPVNGKISLFIFNIMEKKYA